MSGYRRLKKTYRLVFDDPDMEGLEVVAKSTSMGEFLKIQRVSMRLQQNPEIVEQDLTDLDDLFGRFAKVLVSWNLLDDDDRPVPATKDGLLDQDPDFVMAIISAWTDAVGGVDPDLGKDSAPTGTFPEVSIPMELLSASPGN